VIVAVTTSAPLDEHQVLVMLVQVALLVGLARIMGGLAGRLGQPPVVGELLAGIILGPSVFRVLSPAGYGWVFGGGHTTVDAVVFGLAWIGVILLLLALGYETDLAIIGRFRRAAIGVSAGSFMIPFAVFIGVALLVPDEFIGEAGMTLFAAFFALALSVSALPVVAKILSDLGYLRRDFGQITLAAGMTMDAVGWLILAALSGVALQGSLDIGGLAVSFGGLLVFLVGAATIGRWALDRLFRMALRGGSSVTAALTAMVVAGLVGGAITQALHLEAILGAFIVGILLGVTRHQLPRAREALESVTISFFAPIFFAYSGLRVDFTSLHGAAVWWLVGVVLLAIAAKVGGTWIGARAGGLDSHQGFVLGAGLSALGAMGIVVAIIGLNLGVLAESAFTVLVLTALVTSLFAPQLLKLTARDRDIPDEERRRLEEESLRESSLILRSHRILVPTRGGANSVYAAHLIAAAFPKAEVTVLVVEGTSPTVTGRLLRRTEYTADPSEVIDALKRLQHRLVRRRSHDPVASIVAESTLGYDLLVLGASEADSDERGMFSTVVDRTLAKTHLPVVIVRTACPAPEQLPRRFLVPVSSELSTRAAEELAYAIARSNQGEVTALHVVNRPSGQGMMMETTMEFEARRDAAELVAEAAGLGARLGVSVEPLIRVAPNAVDEILSVAATGEFDLLVLGTSTRPLTDRPFLGHGTSYMIEHTPIPVVIVGFPAQLPGVKPRM
jgi:Kef-type K+ transport system membrane component KefB/nucleotide-binding universal stress UspA family protein